MQWTRTKVALLSRKPAGYDNDLFIFRVNGEVVKRWYGRWYDDEQAVNLLRKEMEQGES